jgi:molybdopterin molybdotransferase
MMSNTKAIPGMLSVQEAKALITAHTVLRPPVTIALEKALSKVLAADIHSPASIPAFEQSSMDGYAFQYAAWQQGTPLEITGEMAAGATVSFAIAAGQAARIFTGAPLPAGADTVVMQENVIVSGHQLIIKDDQLQKGINVRPTGSEIEAGTLALPRGTLLTPAAIGFLAGMGIHEVSVFPAPVITIIITGNELQTPGKPLEFGQVYESNSFTLRTALQQMQIAAVSFVPAEDDPDKLSHTIQKALSTSDLVLLTGGVSVGNYDYVAKALEANGVTPVFHRLKQRPGKPLYFGKKDNRLVFGLPGNPSSVLTCFYEYVYACIRQQMGYAQTALPTTQLPLLNDYSKKPGLTHFLKGYCSDEGVRALQAQESYRMQSFAVCNGLIVLPEEATEFTKGQLIDVHVLPG